jgi:hypothetical protein
MAEVLNIISTNYSGYSSTITYSPSTGGTITITDAILPYFYSRNDSYYYGQYELYFSAINKTCSFELNDPMITPSPTRTPCLTPSPSAACPLPEPPSCEKMMFSCYPTLTYRIINVCQDKLKLDRPLYELSIWGCKLDQFLEKTL